VPDIRILDANVILRYLLGDHPELSVKAKRFFDDVRSGEGGAYITESVVVECVCVMQRLYRVPRDEITNNLSTLLGFRGISGDQVTLLRSALNLYGHSKVSFVDALIVTTADAKQLPVETYDKDLIKLLNP